MTKEDFIREVQKLDSRTRKEVVEQSDASQAIKKVAKQDLPPETAVKAAKAAEHHAPLKQKEPTRPSVSAAATTASPAKPSEEQGETAVERKRRLAVLSNQKEEESKDTGETPAERRRREAALGVGNDDDSDDEGTERVPPNRRGITFAESTRPGRGRTGK